MEEKTVGKSLLLVLVSVAVGVVVYLLPTPEGLAPQGHAYLAMLAALLIMFLTEPLPLPLVMVISGLSMILLGIGTHGEVWAAYAHPVVFFILGCLMVAVVAEKVGLTDRLGKFILRHSGTNVVRFSFVMCMFLGLSSSVMHDIAAAAAGLMLMIPLMRAADIHPFSRMGMFLTLSLPFCCSVGGMGTLVGGGRNMVSAAFLDEITNGKYTIDFVEWMLYAMPGAILSIPAIWFTLYLVFRPDRKMHFRELTEEEKVKKPFTANEIKALIVIGIIFVGFFTRAYHGVHFSVIVMAAVILMVLMRLMDWKELHHRTDWGVCILVFGGGISLGLHMGVSGAAEWLASVFFPFFEGRGWLPLLFAVGVFSALLTNLMANVAAAALILPIAIPLALMEGIDPTFLAMTLGMWTSFAYLLVIGCPPNVVAYSFGYFRPIDLTKAGLVAMPVGILVMLFIAVTWWRIVGLI